MIANIQTSSLERSLRMTLTLTCVVRHIAANRVTSLYLNLIRRRSTMFVPLRFLNKRMQSKVLHMRTRHKILNLVLILSYCYYSMYSFKTKTCFINVPWKFLNSQFPFVILLGEYNLDEILTHNSKQKTFCINCSSLVYFWTEELDKLRSKS